MALNLLRPHPSPSRSASRKGLALVVVLFAVLFVSFLVVLFLSLASRDRTGTSAYAETLKAEELAQGGLEFVVEELRKEITDSARSVSHEGPNGKGPTVYVPKETKFLLPERTVADSLKNLLKVSRRQQPLYEQGIPYASAAATLTPSGNGRAVSLDRWRKPALAAFDDAAATPDWIYFTRQGPVANPTLPAASDPKSASFVTGRIAFAIYDTGGILDLNVAGYPAELSPADAGKKGPSALARLQALGLTDGQIENLIAFRNPSSRSRYRDYINDAGNHQGFTRTVPGDNRFLSRQELIRFAEREGFADKLHLVGMFSAEKNAPSYAPPAGISQQTANPAINANLATARHDSSGRLLFEKRFPLSKIALLADPATGNNPSEIKKYFGIEYNPTTRTFTYTGQDSSARSSIKTLSQIAEESTHRQPDFFETLKAAIYSGSVGQSAGETASIPEQDSADEQIIRIGASIIDQYDEDYIPMSVYFGSAEIPIWGVENLPYFNKLQYIGQDPNTQGIFHVAEGSTRNNHSAAGPPDYRFRWAVELWNPHIQKWPATGVPAPDITVALGPEGAQARVDVFPNATATESPDKLFGTPGTITSAEHRNRFNIASGYARGTPSIATWYRYFADPRQVFFGEVNNKSQPIPRPPNPANPTQYLSHYKSSVLTILHPVYVDLIVHGPDGFPHHYFRSWKIWAPLKMTPDISHVTSFMQSDPRTNRMGIFSTDWRPNASSGAPNYPSTISVASRYAWPIRISPSLSPNESVRATDPAQIDKGYSGGNVYAGLLYENTVPATQFEDPDGVIRQGDGGFSPADSTQVPMMQLNTNPAAEFPSSASNHSRPRILDRPFYNVGELGYTHRDAAWKTLNFSSADSADAGLLDVFSIADAETQAGKASLNSPHPEVWAALIGRSLRQEDDASSALTDAQAAALGEIFAQAHTAESPIGNISEIVTKLSTPANFPASALGGADKRAIKAQREAVIRSLSDSMQSRTWNIMIDLVAQTGRLPANAANLDAFMVESERRYWLHIAIDRYTGEIIDEQLEVVVE